jgi:hypothetical protein
MDKGDPGGAMGAKAKRASRDTRPGGEEEGISSKSHAEIAVRSRPAVAYSTEISWAES